MGSSNQDESTVWVPNQTDAFNSQASSSHQVNHPQQNTASSEATETDEPPRDYESVQGFRRVLIFASIYLANILYGLDTTIVADIQGAISETYDNVTQLGWLGVGFALGSIVATLPLGKAYGIFDSKWIFITCLTMFSAASALCGAAPTMNAMIVGRVWAGMGGAGMYLGTLNLTTRLSSPKDQPFYIGLTGFVYGGGCILGPIVGGTLADSAATWRWAFYINLLIFAILSPVHIFMMPSVPVKPDVPVWDKVKSIDWVGTVLTAGLYSCFVVAFAFGGAVWPWNDGRIIALFVITGLFLIAFCVTQYYSFLTTKADRLFPCDLLCSTQPILLFICMACGGAALFVSVYYIPLYFLFVDGDSGTQAAIRLLPFVCVYVVTTLVCGAMMGRTGYHIVWYTASGIFLVIGAALMYTVRRDTSAANIYGYTVLLGLGMTTSQAGYAVGNMLVKPNRAAEMIQFLNISQGQSQVIALAVASAIFQTKTFAGLQKALAGYGFSDSEIRAAIAGAKSQVLQSVTQEVRDRCVDVIVETISSIWIMVMAAGALYTVSSLFLTRSRHISPQQEGLSGEKREQSAA